MVLVVPYIINSGGGGGGDTPGGIIPSGTVEIKENTKSGELLDIARFATAKVAVPTDVTFKDEPLDIYENKDGIDVTEYKTVNVWVQPSYNLTPLPIYENGIQSVIGYKEVNVQVQLYTKVQTASDMEQILNDATEDSVGQIYLYIGPVTENYITGSYYMILPNEVNSSS